MRKTQLQAGPHHFLAQLLILLIAYCETLFRQSDQKNYLKTDQRSRNGPAPGEGFAKEDMANDNCPKHAGLPKRRDDAEVSVARSPEDDGIGGQREFTRTG